LDDDFYCMHSELCKTLANDKRQMILGALRDDELSVGQLVDITGIPQANLSQHLSIMRARGVVRARRDGVHVFYSISNPKLIQAFDLITEVMQETIEERARSGAKSPKGAEEQAIEPPPRVAKP
jgi:ArsR family transcriptional regulator